VVDVEQLVDPELEGLLRELASRPRSVFLRSSRKDAMRVLRSRTTEPLSGMAVSDALERELVTVHRAELAEILKQACRTKLLEGEREKLFVMRYRTATDRVDPVPMSKIRSRLACAVGAGPAQPWEDAMTAVGTVVSPQHLGVSTVLELAAVGQQLQPGDTWRVLAAFHLNSHKSPGSAKTLALSVLNGQPGTTEALQALEMLSVSASLEGCVEQALVYLEEAITLTGSYALAELNRLRCSLIVLDERRVLDASSRLDSMLSADHPLVVQSCAASKAQRQMGEWTPRSDAFQLSLKLESRLGDVAREVSRVFQ